MPKDAGLPGLGVIAWWPGYQNFTRAEKEAKIIVAHQEVLAFGSRWNDILQLLGFPPVNIVEEDGKEDLVDGDKKASGWAGGESDAHKALKEYALKKTRNFRC